MALLDEKTSRKAKLALAGLGMLIAIYLAVYHFIGIPLMCPETGLINCNNVLNSTYANLFGVPLGIYGILFFIGEFALLLYNTWEPKDALFLYNLAGIAFVAYLIYAEYMIGNICLYCTAVHIIVTSLFLLCIYDMLGK